VPSRSEVAVRVVRTDSVRAADGPARRLPEERVGGARQRRDIRIAPGVAIDHHERCVAEQRQRMGDAAGGFQRALRFGRPPDRDAERRAITQRLHQLVAQMRMVDDDVRDARGDQTLDVPHDERLAARFEQRFGQIVGERPHAFAAAGGEDHCLHRYRLRRCSRSSA
jgi:hypothetical protein